MSTVTSQITMVRTRYPAPMIQTLRWLKTGAFARMPALWRIPGLEAAADGGANRTGHETFVRHGE